MSDAPYIPQKTLEALAATHPEGTRHSAKIQIAIPLLGNGLPASAVCATLREKFPAASQHEIEAVVNWCASKNPQPSGNGNGHSAMPTRPIKTNGFHAPVSVVPQTPEQAAKDIIGSDCRSEEYWFERSPSVLSDDYTLDAAKLLATLYRPDECINLITQFTLNDKGKANPQGSGKTLPVSEWIKWFAEKGNPASKAGAWIRPNPCNMEGSGKNGAICDADIASNRFIMVESDSLTLEQQFTLYSKLPLPISAIILSGGDSAHAWLKVDCQSAEEYAEVSKEFYSVAETLGFDKANKNASRLSRLPGVKRTIGANQDGRQRLIFLDPNPVKYSFSQFKASATPALGLIRADSLGPRFREHMKPKKPAFTLSYLGGIDVDHGFYFRDGEVTIWSGLSGHGKSTMLSTVMLRLIANLTPFFICSLEYKPEKLVEMMCRIVFQRPISADEGADFLESCGNSFSFADVVGEIEPIRLISLMRSAHARHGAKHFFIDSLMRVAGLEEDYPRQGQFVNELQAVAKETGGHIHLVAHPRKIDESTRARKMDVKGSSMLVNNADNVVTMRRNTAKRDLIEAGDMTPEKDEAMHDAEFCVEKQRESGWEGTVKLKFNRITKTFELFEPKKITNQFKTK